MEDNTQNTSGGQGRTFDKALNEDINDFHLPSNSWTQARNAINNSNTGDLGKLGNEPANTYCVSAPYPVIGYIHIIEDKWAVFSTDNTNSEIGLFVEGNCGQDQQLFPAYTTIVNDACLAFTQDKLVIGVSRALSTCTYKLYWDDGINPSRVLEIDVDNPARNLYSNPESTIPWKQDCNIINSCNICTNKNELDCDKIRLAKFISPICPRVEKGFSGGNLINGSYMVAMAYAIKGQKISDWYVSNIQGLFSHENTSSSIDVYIDSVDADYDELIVAVISSTNQQVAARQAGIYSTRQKRLSFDIIQDSWPAIPIEQLPLMTPIANMSDAMYSVGEYLLRVGPTSKEDFNYQPLANQIVTKWQSVEYTADYYRKGNNHVGYLRDEVYSFFIQWIYDTGDKSASYHIPGRPAVNYTIPNTTVTKKENVLFSDNNSLEGDEYFFETYNTAVQTSTATTTLSDGGVVIAEGNMGYWQSSENYPDNKPQIWNASSHTWSAVTSFPYSGTVVADYDLCGKPIRHHKFPEDNLSDETVLFNSGTGNKIRIMGVKFENVKAPVTNNGTVIPGIIGYEILRGTRNGNKTIIAKGMINHMRQYDIPDNGKTGLSPNYPYNDLGVDPFLSSTRTSTNLGNLNGFIILPDINNGGFSRKHFTFHSPETNFNNPYLAVKEFKLYGTISGNVFGKYDYSEDHPKEKLITNFSFLIAAFGGIATAIQAANGTKSKKYTYPKPNATSIAGVGPALTAPNPVDFLSYPVLVTALLADQLADFNLLTAPLKPGLDLAAAIAGIGSQLRLKSAEFGFNTLVAPSPFITNYSGEETYQGGYTNTLGIAGAVAGIPLFLNYFSDGTDTIIRLIKSIIRYRDFALRYHSHGFYNTFNGINKLEPFRISIDNSKYINPEILSLDATYQINNLYRQRTVTFETTSVNNTVLPIPSVVDDSRRGIVKPNSGVQTIEDMVNVNFTTKAASHYGALKVRIKNQYSQLNNIVQVPISHCYSTGSSTNVLFGGDTYINRYTEKNTFFYFYNWLEGQPDGAQLDYSQHVMIPYPKYWANFNQFQTSDFTSSFFGQIASFGQGEPSVVPSSYYVLDNEGFTSSFGISFSPEAFRFDVRGWFYLFSSGVRDFFVESEINTAYRDYGELQEQKYFDPYAGSDTKDLFETSIIKSGNYYKYDWSLSVSKMFTNYVSWASSQPISYDPYIAETCYVYNPTRAIYSLPAQYEGLKDGWLVFLPSNYNDFDNVVTCIKPVNKSGAMIFFDAASPVQFQGTDQLETGLGTKLTIGDGALFSQPMQALINVDSSHEYASCQNRLSVINTPAGLYWISQNQGKIFSLQGGIKEVSNMNMKWWFAQYLPYVLTEQFPDFELIDNPVTGIGCQSMYNNQDGIVYFSKKDYKLKPEFKNIIEYTGSSNVFRVTTTQLEFKLGDPTDIVWQLYFEDASWTISYDPKTDGWIGYHDWHPSLTLPGKNTFMTTNPNDLRGIWIHNERCDLYCNYYNIDQPFEVEFMVNTAQNVTSLRSIEYIMEAYKYAPNCYDRFHVLDYNFNEAIIYNTEQTSGVLKLVINPKENPNAILQYPIINPTNINVLFSKEENKYRFNQFWDVTKDRGEYYNPTIPGFAQRPIWNTGANGYSRVLNTFNLNYNKPPFQRKKFRHYTTSVLLRKAVVLNQSMTYKMLVMIANTKNLNSPR